MDLLEKVVRNLEYMTAEHKRELLKQLVGRWSLLAKSGIVEWDSVVEQFICEREIEDKRSRKDFRTHMHSVGRKLLPVLFAGMFNRAVANPILNDFLKDGIGDHEGIRLEQFFSFAALLEADLATGFAVGQQLVGRVRMQKPVGWKYLLHLMAGCLYSLRRRRALPRDLHDIFTKLAVDIEVALGLPRSKRNWRARDIRGELVQGLVKH